MAGHSKWKQIKHKKGIADQRRAQVFSKLSRLITIAVAEGGGIPNPDLNVKLRLAVEKAKEANMPKENIQRAIEKGSGPDKAVMKEVVYEAFGPGGINLIISATTDNSNRTIAELRSLLDRNGGKMGAQGSVLYLFTKCVIVNFEKNQTPEDKILEFAEQVNAIEIEEQGSTVSVYFPFEKAGPASDLLKDLKGSAPEIDYKPQTLIKIEDEGTARKILNLMETLESHDDVQRVFSNFDIPEALMNSV